MQRNALTLYCPYTNTSIREEEANSEHIVPLALGGSGAFQIPVSRDFNSQIGSTIDGVMANDFFIAMERTRYDARGHSGRKPTAHVKHAKFGPDERPAQAHFSVTEGLRIWDAVERRELSESETAGKIISFRTIVDVDLRLKFVAKVALAAGYFIYRDLFKDQVQHDEFRGVMNQQGEDLDQYRDFTIRADDPLLTPEPTLGSQLAIVRGACEAVKGSVVMLIPSSASLMVAVGVLGKYVGMLSVAANTKTFPNSGPFAWGHVVVLTRGTMKRVLVPGLLEQARGARRRVAGHPMLILGQGDTLRLTWRRHEHCWRLGEVHHGSAEKRRHTLSVAITSGG